ncbi:MAG: methyltransferase domain-containing protein [Nitrosopumilus sp.]|nr:methyltransferase domain-containing protein [Nitrosopumilus sp.]
MKIWNEVAPRYHKRWASVSKGPFQSTTKLIELVNINKGNTVLDLGCGTGVVTKKIQSKVGKSGYVVGVDTSTTAIKIAKKWNGKKSNLDFINIDAEKFSFLKKFDIVTCQYALFFFPNAQKALKNIRNSLKKSGKIGISVHGNKENVPFFSSILDSVTKFIPDYVPPGSPNLDRFGTKSALKKEISKAGFSKIVVKEFIFEYSPGKFEDYWKNYIKYIAKPLKEKLDELENSKRKELKQLVKEKTTLYTKKNGRILFPWQVLILTAKY